MTKGILYILCLALFAFASWAGAEEALPQEATPAKNLILYLATGMGHHQYKLLEAIAEHDKRVPALRQCAKQLRLTTDILGSPVPDTAGGSSTLATGQKCPRGLLSMSPQGLPLPTLLEQAQQSGRSVGLVTLGALTDGAITPFAVHSDQPDDFEDRARQLFEARIAILVGSDQEVFRRARDATGRPLLTQMQDTGYILAEGNRRDFLHARKTPLVAFFEHTFRADKRFFPQEPGLQQILFKAFSLLKQNPNGFFLVVETAALDRSCRMRDIAGLAFEMLELDEAVEAGLRFAETVPQTLIVVTSPHETGNFLTVKGELPRFVRQFRNIRCSPIRADQEMGDSGGVAKIMQVFRDTVGIKSLEQFETNRIVQCPPGQERVRAIAGVISHHLIGGVIVQDAPSGRSVPCFVHGPGADSWPDTLENHELAPRLRRLLGLREPE